MSKAGKFRGITAYLLSGGLGISPKG